MIKDTPEVRLSKTISWLLRHGAKSEGLAMRTDGCVKVEDLLANPKIKSQNVDFARLQAIVTADAKQRYALLSEPAAEEEGRAEETWWIKANQGHSITTVEVEMKSILSIKDIPSACAVHGTSMAAWKSIAIQGLSKMKRNHIHLAQGVSDDNVISGMRRSSQVFIYVDVQKAIDAGIKFFLSDNGVVLTSGDETGFLKPEYFDRVVTAKNEVLLERSTTSDNVVQPIVQGTSEISI
ncbi:hypothetical protein M378DRAFT_76750 [Amanita muscaria Koide BX008]|uniref:2'-phosphotransferase n=1 Tax=Amanita muscaria (strain Koide BX008) TaxID=946122 RepID=A0A0C2SQK1_AMAMK|nr:hypothetical protein M378DRAFT_76750 [Amanita muscaria Koide BX008]